jgi:hypothetical protein
MNITSQTASRCGGNKKRSSTIGSPAKRSTAGNVGESGFPAFANARRFLKKLTGNQFSANSWHPHGCSYQFNRGMSIGLRAA